MKNQNKNVTQKSPKKLKNDLAQPGKDTHEKTGFNGSSSNAKGNINTDTKTFNKPRK